MTNIDSANAVSLVIQKPQKHICPIWPWQNVNHPNYAILQKSNQIWGNRSKMDIQLSLNNVHKKQQLFYNSQNLINVNSEEACETLALLNINNARI